MDNEALFDFAQWVTKHDISGLSDEEIVKSFMIEKIQNANFAEMDYPNIKTDLISRVKKTQLT